MSLIPLAFASALLLFTHLGFSGSLRPVLAGALGERAFRVFFALTALGSLVVFVWMFNHSPRSRYFWYPDPQHYLIAKGLMIPAVVLLALGLLARWSSALAGVCLVVTRHPLLWAVMFWSGSHLLANGDRAAVIFFGTFLLWAFLGALAIDGKLRRRDDPDAVQLLSSTSNVPLFGLLRGRARGSARGLLAASGIAAVLYAAGFYGHRWLGGVGSTKPEMASPRRQVQRRPPEVLERAMGNTARAPGS